jgi:hypothetical protein
MGMGSDGASKDTVYRVCSSTVDCQMAAGDGGPNGGRLGWVTNPEPLVFGQRLRDGRTMKNHNHLSVADRGTVDGISITPATPWLRSRLTKQNRIVNLFDPPTSFGPATIAVLDHCRSSTNSGHRQPAN